MPIVRSVSNAFAVTDWTPELLTVPNQFTVLREFNLFEEESVSQHTVTFEEINKSIGLLKDQVRGYKPQTGVDYTRKIHSYAIPHFPYADQILPGDIQGRRAYGSDAAETKNAVMARKIERAQASFDATKEIARWATLANGDIYSPSGVVVGNYYTDFGVSRKTVSFALGVGTTDIVAKCEEAIAEIQDKLQTGDVITQFVAFCSPGFFSSLISHPKVQAAYTYYSANANQEILRNRAGGAGYSRRFEYAGVTFIEVRQQINGTKFLSDNTAIFVPVGTRGLFKTYYAPANRMDYVNTLGEAAYLWSFEDPRGENVTIEGESNFLNLLARPQIVVGATVA